MVHCSNSFLPFPPFFGEKGAIVFFFVSNYVGKTPFAALNLIYPFLMLLGALGFMMGTGGTAIVARKLGEDRKKEANAAFSMLVEATVIGGVILTIPFSLSLPSSGRKGLLFFRI